MLLHRFLLHIKNEKPSVENTKKFREMGRIAFLSSNIGPTIAFVPNFFTPTCSTYEGLPEKDHRMFLEQSIS
jgi:peroxiredoxin